MFLHLLLILAVSGAFLSAISLQNENIQGTVLDFETLNVPVNNEIGQRLTTGAKAHRHKSMVDHFDGSIVKSIAEKEGAAGFPGTVIRSTKFNADCSGGASTVYYSAVGHCRNFIGMEFSMRTLCFADGDQIDITYSAYNCPDDSMTDQEVKPAVPCSMHMDSFGQHLMTSSSCIANASAPPSSPGLMERYYDSPGCSGRESFVYNRLFYVCNFQRDETAGAFYYTKMVGCSADGGVQMVMYSDRDCLHPMMKATVSLGDSTHCSGVYGSPGSMKVTCNV